MKRGDRWQQGLTTPAAIAAQHSSALSPTCASQGTSAGFFNGESLVIPVTVPGSATEGALAWASEASASLLSGTEGLRPSVWARHPHALPRPGAWCQLPQLTAHNFG